MIEYYRSEDLCKFPQPRVFHLWLGNDGLHISPSIKGWVLLFSEIGERNNGNRKAAVVSDFDSLLTLLSLPSHMISVAPDDSFESLTVTADILNHDEIQRNQWATYITRLKWKYRGEMMEQLITVRQGVFTYFSDHYAPFGLIGAYWYVLNNFVWKLPNLSGDFSIPQYYSLIMLNILAKHLQIDERPWLPLRQLLY